MIPRYASMDAVAIGCGSTEHIQQLSAGLSTSEAVAGRLVAVYDRVVYVGFETESSDAPRILAIGDATLRSGPLLTAVELEIGSGFSQLDLAPGDPCRLRVRASTLELIVDNRLRVHVSKDLLQTLPVGQSLPGVPATEFHPANPGFRGHRRLLTRLLNEPVTDGIGWLETLEQYVSDGDEPRINRLIAELQSSSVHTDDVLVSLLGRGPGSTPSGDDILCGLLVTAQCIEHPLRETIWPIGSEITRIAIDRTTPVSQEMLRQASLGRSAAPFGACLNEMLSTSAASGAQATRIQPVLDIGHTSGCALLAGMLTVTLALVPAVV